MSFLQHDAHCYVFSLLQHGADARLLDHDSRSALWYAQTSGNKDCERLIASHVDALLDATLPRSRNSHASAPLSNDSPRSSSVSSHVTSHDVMHASVKRP